MWYGGHAIYNSDLFYVWINGFVSRSDARNGTFCGSDDPVCDRDGGNKDRVDFLDFSFPQKPICIIYFLSCILDDYNCYAGDMLFGRTEKAIQENGGKDIKRKKKGISYAGYALFAKLCRVIFLCLE